ncbi:hypothetical protein ScPMuIL_006879 [Solemya velum]
MGFVMWSRYSQCLFPLLYMLSLYFDSYLGDLVMVTEKKLNWTMSVNNCSSYGMELLQPKNETVMLDLKYFLNTSIAQKYVSTSKYVYQRSTKIGIQTVTNSMKMCLCIAMHDVLPAQLPSRATLMHPHSYHESGPQQSPVLCVPTTAIYCPDRIVRQNCDIPLGAWVFINIVIIWNQRPVVDPSWHPGTPGRRTIDEIWIGLKYDTASESYYWQDGSSLLIDTYWMGNVKEKEKEKKLCVKIVVETLLWNIENCSTPHTYICQRDDDADSLPDSPDVVIFQPTEPPASITSSRDDKNSEGLLLWQPDEDEVVSTLVVGVAICFVAITIGFLGWKYFLHDWFDNMAQRPSPRNDITSESELLRRSFGVTSAESYTK